MAKKEKVKKGFGMYLFLFLLFVGCLFVIWVIAMFFLPQRVILGLQYYTYSSEVKEERTTDTKVAFNFFNTRKIVVNSNASSVLIQKADVDSERIVFVNKSSGFATGSDNVAYKHEIKYSDRTLTVNVTEPQGFLKLSQNTQIIFQVPQTSTYNFENTEFVISTESGSVVVGNTSTKDGTNAYLNLKKLSVNTQSGNIRITQFMNSNFDSLFLSTKSGRCYTDHENIQFSSLKLATENGRFDFTGLTHLTGGVIEANLGNGRLNVKNLQGSLSLVCKDAEVNVESISKDLIGNNMKDKINRAKINVGRVEGNISLPYLKDSNLTINDVGGEANIESTSGNITIGGENTGLSKTSFIKTKNGKINVKLLDNTVVKHNFATESGDITITYLKEPNSRTNVVSSSGNVNLFVKSGYKFKLTMKNSAGELYEKTSGKISIDLVTDNLTNPLLVNGYTGDEKLIDISTNGNISAKLI